MQEFAGGIGDCGVLGLRVGRRRFLLRGEFFWLENEDCGGLSAEASEKLLHGDSWSRRGLANSVARGAQATLVPSAA